ncbi:hypothetical protein DFQ26_006673 [Actinomortierella ambigua]|nr:hypothetical protein DFQ26_006673 [Actinomortierella ambigua]
MEQPEQNPGWYTDAQKYWDNVPATINGMLGGLGQLARPDAVASLRFLSEYVTPPTSSISTSIQASDSSSDSSPKRPKLPLPGAGPSRVLDCGAGIGRVTKQVLSKAFDHVDLVENSKAFVDKAKEEYLKEEIESGKVTEVRQAGLQNVTFEGTSWESRFDVIWCQWVLGHLHDNDLIAFFQRCKKGLKPGGMIFVKENNAKVGFVIDEDDSSMTRSDELLKEIFVKAGLRLLRDEVQKGFPPGLFAVKM